MAEVDYSSAAMTLYEGAIYLVQAEPWQVERLDWEGRKAFVRKTRADYYTDAIDYTKLKILDQFEASRPHGQYARGEVHLVRRIAGYMKIRYYTHENVGFGQINLPDYEMHTTAVWWQVGLPHYSRFLRSPGGPRWLFRRRLCVHYVAALLTMSELHDLGRAVGNSDATWFCHGRYRAAWTAHVFGTNGIEPQDVRHFQPTVFLYDNYPGGIGLSTPLYDRRREVVQQAYGLVTACACL